MGTLRPKYLLYGYMEPLGLDLPNYWVLRALL